MAPARCYWESGSCFWRWGSSVRREPPRPRMLTSSCSSASWTTIPVFIGTALLTVSLQSSTASIGLGIGLAQSGLLPGTTIVPWVLGANLGITLTMMMAGWGSIEGRRLAIGSLLIKGSGALVILLGSSRFSMVILNLLPGAIDRKAANLNTFFNLILGLAALPLLAPSYVLIESPVIDDSREPDSYLDPLLLQAPSLALNQAAREELRLLWKRR